MWQDYLDQERFSERKLCQRARKITDADSATQSIASLPFVPGPGTIDLCETTTRAPTVMRWRARLEVAAKRRLPSLELALAELARRHHPPDLPRLLEQQLAPGDRIGVASYKTRPAPVRR